MNQSMNWMYDSSYFTIIQRNNLIVKIARNIPATIIQMKRNQCNEYMIMIYEEIFLLVNELDVS